MKKSTIFKWFYPCAVFIFYLAIFFLWIKPNMAPDPNFFESFFSTLTSFMDEIVFGVHDYLVSLGVPEWVSGILCWPVMMGSFLLALPISACCCVGGTVGYVTRHMGDSTYTKDKGYYEVTFKDDTISVDRATDSGLTGAGWFRALMFFTYLFWFIPVFISQYNKARQE